MNLFKPGELAPETAVYREISPVGIALREFVLVKGSIFPSTKRPEYVFIKP
jgi:hypothetical protein